mgnify:CR=1 FL=1
MHNLETGTSTDSLQSHLWFVVSVAQAIYSTQWNERFNHVKVKFNLILYFFLTLSRRLEFVLLIFSFVNFSLYTNDMLFSFEDDKMVSTIFEEIWEENTSGQSVALQLYASDIIPLILKGLSSTSWTEKKKVNDV